jgi:uncharacterized protein
MPDASIPPLPVGWPLLPVPDANGQLNYPTLQESIRQSVRVILRTRPGEQLMRPRFGGGLQSFLNEPNDLTTRRRIYDLITESLDRWERRILVDRVDVLEVPGFPSRLRVEIVYRIRRTGASQRLGVTMDIGS